MSEPAPFPQQADALKLVITELRSYQQQVPRELSKTL